jgi:hypothetical protein
MTITDSGPGTGVKAPGRAAIAARTLRTDRWWLQPLVTFTVLFLFVVYSSVRAFWNHGYFYGPTHYISPFYSPCLTADCVKDSSDLGVWFGHLRPISPALIILIVPLGFRLTCYYYRKAYYRAFWLSPPACAVAEPHGKYTGETRFPLILQNIHRYFFYLGLVFNVILTYDAVRSFTGKNGGIGVGIGTMVFVVNATLLWLYSLSCHSCRNSIGGRLKHFSKHPLRYKMWTFESKLNGRHMQFAWVSLVWVAFTDFYVWMVATGHITDFRIFH